MNIFFKSASDMVFLTPTGAHETQMFVCLFGESLSRAHNLHLLASDSS